MQSSAHRILRGDVSINVGADADPCAQSQCCHGVVHCLMETTATYSPVLYHKLVTFAELLQDDA